jgi:hypothetical protein
MKKLTILALTLLMFTSCTRTIIVNPKPKALPPGQAKKITGTKSAKSFTPAQQNGKGVKKK